MSFNLFHKKKQPQTENPVMPPQEEPKQEAPVQPPEEVKQEPAAVAPPQETAPQEPAPEAATTEPAPPAEQKTEVVAAEAPSKTYLKAMPLRELSDVENVENEVKNGNIIILKVTPLAGKSIEDVKTAVNELYKFAETLGGDIARLGEERVVICPKTIRIWREKTSAPVESNASLPTAA
jgi:uncharacterized protein